MLEDANPLPFRSLCAVLGVSAAKGLVMNSVAMTRVPGEAQGGICKLVDDYAKVIGLVGTEGYSELTVSVEHNQLEELLVQTTLGGDLEDESGFSPYPGNINAIVLRVPEFAACTERTRGLVPEFVSPVQPESNDDPNEEDFDCPVQLKCLLQDFPRLLGPSYSSEVVGFTQLDRLMCFTCVKNSLAEAALRSPPQCALSAEADYYACNAELLKLAGADIVIEEPEEVTFLGISARLGARIVLRPSFAISLEEMKTKVKGKIRISKRSTLILDGDIVLNGLDLDGALRIVGNGAIRPNIVVHNIGGRLDPIRGDLEAQPPSLRVRGYHVSVAQMETIDLSAR
jgi:UDP-sugar pyrophosphorylase